MSFIASLGDWLRKVSRSFSDVSINGRNIVLTRHNGDTETITTQDTNTTYNNATQSTDGLMSALDKTKLDGIASNAEVNQNAFANVKIGNNTIQASVVTDTIEVAAGSNVTLTPDTANKKITIDATDTVTTISITGTGNAVTDISASNGALTVTKGASYLSLTGGRISGTIVFTGGNDIRSDTNDKQIVILGGSSNSASAGAKLILSGADYTDAGAFTLQTGNSTGYKQLIGKPDETLTWAGKNVTITDDVDPTNSGYIRLTNGLQIVWGLITIKAPAQDGAAVTFEKPFTAIPQIFLTPRFANAYGWGYGPQAVDRTTTGCTVKCGMSSSGTTEAWSLGTISYLAVGPWM